MSRETFIQTTTFFFGCLGENAFNYLGKMQTSDYRWHITHYIHRYIFR